MDAGTEIRLFDPGRNPRDWTELIGPAQCAVFLKSRTTSASLAPDGRPFPTGGATTCLVFDCVAAAQRFCEAKVRTLPHLRCEIYDAQGLANPPLAVVVHPNFAEHEESSPRQSRRRRLIAGALIVISAPLIWLNVRLSNDLFTFLAFSCILLAMRFIYWDFGLRHGENERRRRLEAHRRIERGDA